MRSVGSASPRTNSPLLTTPSSIGSAAQTAVSSRSSGPKLPSAVAVVNSFVFEASCRLRPEPIANRTLPLSASITQAPLRPPARRM